MNKINSWLSDENIQKIKNWHEQGKSKQDIAQEIGIKLQTLNKWCKNYTVFVEIFNSDACTKIKRHNLSKKITQKKNKIMQFNAEEYMLSAMKNL